MSITYNLQGQLKTLPLSNLNDASVNFLDWVKPLVSTEQFSITKENLESFIQEDGRILHKKLEEWSKQNEGNWLAPLWKDMYLDIREPVVIDVNYYIKIITEHLKNKYSSTDIAGVIINKLTDIYESISNETFEPEKVRNTPLCMDAYKEMFKATKIPKLNRDEYIVMPKTKTSHIIVMYKNHMFKLNLTDEDGNRYSCKMIINTLNSLANKNMETNDTSVGLITTAYRDEAAVLLEEIISVEKNSDNFNILKDALFMVCIDETSKDLHEFGMSLIGTNENNRYFDKNLQLIFDKNFNFGFNLEHTGADAGPWINIINIINEQLNSIDTYINNNLNETIKLEQLNWDLKESVTIKLNEIREKHITKIKNIHQEIIYFKDFGSSQIKSWEISPDAFLHLALQLAQYRIFGKLKSTYEATATRVYLKGRTESNRPISMELLEFVKAFDNEELDTKKLKELMNAACQKHTSRIKDCLGSNGIERYFFALKNMYTLFSDELDLKEIPEFFNDKGYEKLTYNYISTSRIESKNFELAGFGPVVPDGFGFWYNLLDNQIDMNLITYKNVNKECVKPFANSIVKSLNDLKKLASK